MFTLGVSLLWTLAKNIHGSNLPIVAFALTGYSSVLVWRNCSNRVVKAVESNLSLMFHRNVKIIDIFAARMLLELAGTSASLIVLTFVFSVIGMMEPPDDVLLSLAAWILLCWFGVALGLIIGALSERTEIIERVWHVILYLLFPISGAGFMLDWLPLSAQKILSWLPMIHGVEMLRHGYFGSSVHTHEEPQYLLMVNIFLTLMGLALTRDTGRRIEHG